MEQPFEWDEAKAVANEAKHGMTFTEAQTVFSDLLARIFDDEAQSPADDMLPEYDFDYAKSRPNRFAVARDVASRVVTLDPDVAAVFTTSDAVNAVLRALIATMPQPVAK